MITPVNPGQNLQVKYARTRETRDSGTFNIFVLKIYNLNDPGSLVNFLMSLSPPMIIRTLMCSISLHANYFSPQGAQRYEMFRMFS